MFSCVGDTPGYFYTTIPLLAVLKIIDEDPGAWEWEGSGTASIAVPEPLVEFRAKSLILEWKVFL